MRLKVVQGEYPFYGELQLDPPGPLSALLDEQSAVVAPELLTDLGLRAGDLLRALRIGGADFRVAGVVLDEPDRIDFSLRLAPRVFLSAQGFERASLLGFGNRVRYRALLCLPDGASAADVGALEERLETRLESEPELRIETYADAQRGLRRGVERFSSFLGLVALLSLVLGGIGVAQVTRSWLATRALSIAVWKSLGLTPREIVLLYLGHALLSAAAGSLLGGLLGGVVPFVVPHFAPELLVRGSCNPGSRWRYCAGAALGVGVSALFALSTDRARRSAGTGPQQRRPLRTPRLVTLGATAARAGPRGAWIRATASRSRCGSAAV